MKALPSYGSYQQAIIIEVARLMADVMASIDHAIGQDAGSFGMTGPQWIVLMRIHHGQGATAAALCRALRYDSGSMTRMLSRLVTAGLIERCPDENDRRVVQLQLTPKGTALLAKVEPIGFKVMERFLAGFSPQEIECLTGFLHRMLNVVHP